MAAHLEVNGTPQANGTPKTPLNTVASPMRSRANSFTGRHAKLAPHFIGGNRLDAAPSSKVKEFVESHDGHTVITNVLIANNGIAAVKEIRSVRKWAYETFGDERAIQFTVMATPEDLKANADYIRMADQYVEVPGGTNNNNYANVELIVDVAERMNVHAVWAGWGHASENPKLPESLAASPNKIVFIGPPGSAMRSLGDKISSTIVAQHAHVPCIPWSGEGVDEVTIDNEGIVTVTDAVYDRGCTHSWEEGLERARKIGFPVMVKASEGGGGKGIRRVDGEEKFKELYQNAASEIPGSPMFVMKLAGNARHLEVQLLADQYGNNISLFGRDCSVQRRHQKIIEEAPVTIARPITFTAMEKAAVRLGKLVGYVSAGTVEYLYSHADDKFYFLELNPRLQVEHPTTEMVSGVNLPAAQLQIAMGIPLHRIRDIRLLYGVDPHKKSMIDFDFADEESVKRQRQPQPQGHTTACRITSEDPGAGFKPSSGTMHDLNFRSSSNVWGYFSVGAGSSIHELSDSQFGHIFAYGENRAASRKHMVVALKELSIRGDFRNIVEYLIKLLETEAFEENTITTGWLDELISKKLTAERPDPTLAVVCGAVTKAHVASEDCIQEYRRGLEKGQVPSKDVLKTVFPIEFIYEGFRYKFTATRSSLDTYHLFINGSKCSVGVRPLADGGLLVLLNGRSHNIYWTQEVEAMRMSVDGKTCLLEQESDPTQLRTQSPGKLVKFTVDSGDHIKAGQTYAEVEVMKMVMPLVASEDGTVQLIKQPNATLEAGDIIAILSLDDPSRVKHAQPFLDKLPDLGQPQVIGTKPVQRFRALHKTLQDILQGFDNQFILSSTLNQLIKVLRDFELPYSAWTAQIAALHARMPQKLNLQLTQVVERAHGRKAEFPAKTLQKTLDRFIDENVPANDANLLRTSLKPLTDIMDMYADGLQGHEYTVFAELLDEYIEVEKLFTGRTVQIDEVVLKLRDENKGDIQKVVQTVLSHARVGAKNNLALAILENYRPNRPGVGNVAKYFRPALRRLTELDSRATTKVSLKAREVLIQCALPSLAERASQMEHILKSAVTETRYGEAGLDHRNPDTDFLREVIDSKYTVFDVLAKFFSHADPYVVLAATEVYVRRAYRAYNIHEIDHVTASDAPFLIKFEYSGGKGYLPELGMAGESTASTPASPAAPGSANRMDPLKRLTMADTVNSLGKAMDKPRRDGVVVPAQYLDDAEEQLERALEQLPSRDVASPTPRSNKVEQFSAVCSVVIQDSESKEDSEVLATLEEIIQRFKKSLMAHRVRRVTFLCGHADGSYPAYFTFRAPEYREDENIRHIEPAVAFQLELGRLAKFKIKPIFTENRNIHVYEAIGKDSDREDKVVDKRYFTRAVVRPGRLRDDIPTAEYLISEADRLTNDILDALEVIGNNNSDMNHIFINFSQRFQLNYKDVENALGGFLDRFGRRAWRLRVTAAEIRIICTDAKTGLPFPLRVMINNTFGFVIQVELYTERKSDRGGEPIFQYLSGTPRLGSMHLRPVTTPYATKGWLQPKRYKAHIMGTQYVYDFPELFRQAYQNSWSKAVEMNPSLASQQPSADECMDYTELVLDDNDNIAEVSREPGTNAHGMVGWLITAKTPEYPKGRRFVIIANDITFEIGSFGPIEDKFFYKCTELARKLGIPRIYLSANSGARINLADELIPHLNAAWNNPEKPETGFKYLYLTPEAKKQFEDGKTRGVITEPVHEDGEERHKITTVIGEKDGLGVECLRGSGLIAGETSKAYNDIFTITLVTCRSVGIGAYLVRLGQRTIQIEGQPIILTGAQAINNLLGREIYTSNLQLGGTQIMYRNGVSHMTANDDFEGVSRIVEWLSYVPDKKNSPVPITLSGDSWDRDVTFQPPVGAYDVRHLIAGKASDNGFELGLFDKDSFVETLGGWAQTVVVGRARIGGIPMGVIGVEVRTVENNIPADPANPDSMEMLSNEAGATWFPNSAFKTAQAIKDFNNGEQLPLMILANWRGFSGGQRDMFNEVLKYGSYIVDALTEYQQPIFVYIPPFGQLRGGSWVVVDPTINPEFMEMYADEESRGGVLEPEGIVGIKYKREKQLKTMERLDATYGELKRKAADKNLSPAERQEVAAKIEAREELLLPVYGQIALQFADLHDRAGRMAAKGTIRHALQWRQSRRFFYWRIRRRLNEETVLRKMASAAGHHRGIARATPGDRDHSLNTLKAWSGLEDWESNDCAVATWYEEQRRTIQSKIDTLKTEGVASEVASLLRGNKDGGLRGVRSVLEMLPVEERENVLKYLSGSK